MKRFAWVLLLLSCDEAKKAAEDVANDPNVKKAAEAAQKGIDAATLTYNEDRAKAAMRQYVDAQRTFSSDDLDRNGLQDFWTGDVAGLYCLTIEGTAKPLAALGDSIAAADAKPITAPYKHKGAKYEAIKKLEPYFGYRLRAMEKNADGATLVEDLDKCGVKAKHRWIFAACAYPDKHKQTGVTTFIVNQDGVVYKKDTQGKPVVKWPSPKEIAEEWKEVDRIKG